MEFNFKSKTSEIRYWKRIRYLRNHPEYIITYQRKRVKTDNEEEEMAVPVDVFIGEVHFFGDDSWVEGW